MFTIITYKASCGPQLFTHFTEPEEVAVGGGGWKAACHVNNSWIKKMWLKSHLKMWGHHGAFQQTTFLGCLCLIQHFRSEKSQPCTSTKLARWQLGKRVNIQNIFKMVTSGTLCLGSHREASSLKNWLPPHYLGDKGNQCRDPLVGWREDPRACMENLKVWLLKSLDTTTSWCLSRLYGFVRR